MPESKYDEVSKIRLGNEVRDTAFKGGIKVLALSNLKAENKSKEKNIAEQKKEIDRAIKSARENPLPINMRERFDREFGKKREKNAFKTAVTLILVAGIFSFALQPSIFFVKDGSQLELVNYSQREVKSLSVYSFNDFAKGNIKPIFSVQKFAPQVAVPMSITETTVLLAFAEREMPALGVYVLNQNINNAGTTNTYKTGENTLDIFNGLKGINRVDNNG